ncbi:MAG: ABC transporter ATP-binding protein [Planctomycetes bacterium RBG_16_59_8]|nr:MAG: ABC transporter ATP-binding protein [Planctomycetes bacterium RBG_16_59_8]
MALMSLQNISLAFDGPMLFDRLSMQLESGERVALLGRNGAGKTTLMKIIAGNLETDEGTIIRQPGVNITHLPQEVASDIQGNVFDIVASGLSKNGELLKEYHHISHRLHTEHTPELMRQFDRVHAELDRTQSWDIGNQVEDVVSRMKLDPEAQFSRLSGGQKRRVLLARALVIHPDILLLDEPTNHLDIESIDWLEEFLKKYSGTVLFVTHDRMFLRHLATRIIELDRGKIFSWACDYDTFLERRQIELENEESQRHEFEKKLSQEEIWIRRGVKARRARNEGRVTALERMREEKRNRRQVTGKVHMLAPEAARSGDLVVKVSHLGFGYENNRLIDDFSAMIMRGDKIGVIGPNGSGKTTLLRLLLGVMNPSSGIVRVGTNLEVAYYDQLREQLDEEKTVSENVCSTSDTITIDGKPRHVLGYLQNFLFSPQRARTRVKVLSGGERNRLLLARLFTRPSNVLVMDEPTNDLDVETLELLEELLLDYSGTLLLVSHDRAFLNNVVTSTIVLEGEGAVNEYPGGYDDWVNQRKNRSAESKAVAPENLPLPKPAEKQQSMQEKPDRTKLSPQEEKELSALPARIEQLEAKQAEIYALMADPSFFRKSPRDIKSMKERLDLVKAELARTFERWAVLENARGHFPR